ncbi:hypothetical protein [Actinomadura formosensis]|uniref:hypothetical protein n=1 Tax=Actinomadura formosensis TaxID=60706 RepID=UPI003D8ABC5A
MQVCAIGCGNVGFNTLKAFQVRGHSVFGVDISKAARDNVADSFGAHAVIDRLAELSGMDIVFICVPTDPDEVTGHADLSIMEEVVRGLSSLESRPAWRRHPPVIVQRSTCPPGSAARFSAEFEHTPYAVNPSFLSKATQWEDSDRPPRIAYAGPSEATEVLDEVYKEFTGAPRYVSTSYEAVELLKYIENSIDAVLISLWNEYLQLSDALGMQRRFFVELAREITSRDRFATTLRVPGGSFGKWCLPKDLSALLGMCADLGVAGHVLRGAQLTNQQMKDHGENLAATSELLALSGGRTVPTDTAATALLGDCQGVPGADGC